MRLREMKVGMKVIDTGFKGFGVGTIIAVSPTAPRKGRFQMPPKAVIGFSGKKMFETSWLHSVEPLSGHQEHPATTTPRYFPLAVLIFKGIIKKEFLACVEFDNAYPVSYEDSCDLRNLKRVKEA